MKVFFVIIAVVILGLGAAFYLQNFEDDYTDVEFITEDGFYLRFDGVDCGNRKELDFTLSVSPVRSNNYNSCQNVEIRVGIMSENEIVSDIALHWKNQSCISNQVNQQALSIRLTDYLSPENVKTICKQPDLIAAVLRDYSFRTFENASSSVKTSDPLGQQPRPDSSIPEAVSSDRDRSNSKLFQDVEIVLLVQKKLALMSDYAGPIDGIWNQEMDRHIKSIHDENAILFEDIKSNETLFLLGIPN